MAMLKRASFVNFKNLRQVEVDLEQFTVLVGPNGAGKTSVLQGVFLPTLLGRRSQLDHELGHPFDRMFSGTWSPRRIVSGGANFFRINLFDTGGLEVELQATLEAEDEVFTVAGSVPTAVARRRRSGEVLVSTLEVGRPEAFAHPAVQALKDAVLLRLDAPRMARPSVVDAEEPRLSHDGAGLASVLAYLAGAHPDRKEAIEADLAKIVPWFRRVLVKPAKVTRTVHRPFPVGRQAVEVPVEEEVWGHAFSAQVADGSIVPADLLSEGTVLALGLLTLLHGPRPPRLLLMDDLDRGLHLGGQVRMVRALRALQAQRPELQIVATTHSPFLLQEVGAHEVRVLGLDAEGGVGSRPLAEHPDFAKWRQILGTGEIWANLGEDWAARGR